MRYIEEDTTEYISEEPESIEDVIEDRVDAELKVMLEGESVSRLISELIDEKLKLFLQDTRIKSYHRGPGRGKIGKTHRKFSASVPEALFEEVKSLPGLFSSHLEASLNIYLKILKSSSHGG
jgi:hypothetical protein